MKTGLAAGSEQLGHHQPLISLHWVLGLGLGLGLAREQFQARARVQEPVPVPGRALFQVQVQVQVKALVRELFQAQALERLQVRVPALQVSSALHRALALAQCPGLRAMVPRRTLLLLRRHHRPPTPRSIANLNLQAQFADWQKNVPAQLAQHYHYQHLQALSQDI